MCVQIPHFSVVVILVKHCSLYNKYSYFAERLPEKVHATIPKGIVSGFEFTVDPFVCKKLGHFISSWMM